MGRRYSCKGCAVVTGGTTHGHSLGATPDEWKINLRGPVPAAAYVYVTTVSATSIVVVSDATGTCDVFAHVNHSIVK